jgi:hypothetical protein
MNKLSIEDCERLAALEDQEGMLNRAIFRQLADTMRENERLRKENEILDDSLTHFRALYDSPNKHYGVDGLFKSPGPEGVFEEHACEFHRAMDGTCMQCGSQAKTSVGPGTGPDSRDSYELDDGA